MSSSSGLSPTGSMGLGTLSVRGLSRVPFPPAMTTAWSGRACSGGICRSIKPAEYTSQSTPVETVLFLRDEMADLVWAVEASVEDELERRIDRRALWVGHRTLPPGDRARPSYRVETVVPDYWIPLAPEQLADQQSVRLRLVPMEVDEGGVPRAVEPQGRLLTTTSTDKPLWLFEEEVPREGTVVDRFYRYARWQGGRSALWTARQRNTGHGEGSSGLKFDVLDP